MRLVTSPLLAAEIARLNAPPIAPLVVPLADSRRAALMREHGSEEGLRLAAEKDAEERARLRAGRRMLRGWRP